jgi:hypothetical protein
MAVLSSAFPSGNGHVDFAAVKAASVSAVSSLVPGWLPGGRREGNEWVVRNPLRNDAKAGSFKINLLTGVFCDWATGDKGGDRVRSCAVSYSSARRRLARCPSCGAHKPLSGPSYKSSESKLSSFKGKLMSSQFKSMVQARFTERAAEMVAIAAARRGSLPSQYVRQATYDALRADGFDPTDGALPAQNDRRNRE